MRHSARAIIALVLTAVVLAGLAATGRRATWEGISIVRVACGRIVEAWNTSDGLGFRRQVGIITDDELGTVGTPTVATPAA